jgi:hypothetical protein
VKSEWWWRVVVSLTLALVLSFVAVVVVAGTERPDFASYMDRGEQIAYSKGVQDALAAAAWMIRRGTVPMEQAIAMEALSGLDDMIFWHLLRGRVEPLMEGAVRGLIYFELDKQRNSR